MLRYVFAASAAACLLSACATNGSMAGDMTPTERAAYVTMAGASDLYEIQSSQLALTKAQRPEVRQFAQMLIEHHNGTTQQVVAAAQASGFSPPPPTLMPKHARMIEQLQGASSGSFDRLYLSQQVPAHQEALALHQNYASNGDTPALRRVAATAVPIVQSHLDRARQLD